MIQFQGKTHLRYELAAIITIKLILIFGLKSLCFSDADARKPDTPALDRYILGIDTPPNTPNPAPEERG